MILSLFDYANLTLTLVSTKLRQKMQRLQNRALHIIYFREQNLTIQELHRMANLATLEIRSKFQLLCLMYRRSYERKKYPMVSPARTTRTNEKLKFNIPRPTNEKFKLFPLYRGSLLWDQLSPDVQKCESYLAYKMRVKQFLENKGNYPP